MAASMLAASADRNEAWATWETFNAPAVLPFGFPLPLPGTVTAGAADATTGDGKPACTESLVLGCSGGMRFTVHWIERRLPSRCSALQIENGSFCRMPSSTNLSRTIGGTYMTRSSMSEYIT